MPYSLHTYSMLAIAMVLLEGCFNDSLETRQDGVFACSPATEEVDCPEGRCVNGTCTFEDCTKTTAPTIAFTEPEQLEAFPVDATSLKLVLSGRNLQLVNPQQSDPQAQGQGHVKVFIDDESEPIHTFIEGSLDTANLIKDIERSAQLSPGIHRLKALTFNNAGVPFENICATSEVAFWANDGKEHVGIVKPSPGTIFDLSAGSVDIEVEVAGLNFTFISEFDLPPPNSEGVFGHVHAFVIDPASDFLVCPDGCASSFLKMIEPPQGAMPTIRMVGTLTLKEESLGMGLITLAIDARDSGHNQYFREPTKLLEELVFDQIQLQIKE